MKAWQIHRVADLKQDTAPLTLAEVPVPSPDHNQVLIKALCCGVCHTELDEIEGRTAPPVYPMIPGHQVVGFVEQCGENVGYLKEGDRVGVAWIFSACGRCEFCIQGLENLCPDFQATGRDANGGYAEYLVVSEDFCFVIPEELDHVHVAPLLCAGAIGYRSLKLANIQNGQILGLTGFGGSAHLVLKMVKHLYPQSKVQVFARHDDVREFAREMGADWAGHSNAPPPMLCHAIIDTTPAWQPIVDALQWLRPGGRLVINAIRKESHDQDVLLKMSFHDHLWMEKEIKSVANITRNDVAEFLELASKMSIRPEVEIYPFDRANEAITDLKNREVKGAKVLDIAL